MISSDLFATGFCRLWQLKREERNTMHSVEKVPVLPVAFLFRRMKVKGNGKEVYVCASAQKIKPC
jgi:hypothetical protein